LIAFTAKEFNTWADQFKDREESDRLNNKGVELFNQENLIEAETLFMKAMHLNPKNAAAHSNMGQLLEKRGMYAQAIPWFEKALSLDPFLNTAPTELDFCRKAANEKSTPPTQETIKRLKKAGIEFTQKYSKIRTGEGGLGPIECTYERYESLSVEKAIEFLNQHGPVTQGFYFVEVKTPKGWAGKDIDGIYKGWEQ
jgi:tetratricopeptide (TPR) repeat protein